MRSRKTMKMIMVLPALVTGLAINGCSTCGTPVQADKTIVVPANENSADFLDRASEMQVMDIDNAMHGMCLLLEGQDHYKEFQARLDVLKQRGLVAPGWTLSAGQPLTKGQLAYMVYQACGVKEKGVTLALFGPTRRYCLRELQYQGMMAEGDECMPVTGMEYVAVMTRADVYKRTGKFPNEVGQTE